MFKDNVVIELKGIRYTFKNVGANQCSECVITSPGSSCRIKDEGLISAICQGSLKGKYICISEEPMKSEPIKSECKIYHEANSKDADHLINKIIEAYYCNIWIKATLRGCYVDGRYPFSVDLPNTKPGSGVNLIREMQTVKMTRYELREKYGVPENVEIVEEGE